MTKDNFTEKTIRKALSLKTFGKNLLFLLTTVSTMNEARSLVADNAHEGTLIIADEQTEGKGRFNRNWISPSGVNLYVSLILRPPTEVFAHLAIITSLALARVIREIIPQNKIVSIKWPNDLRINKKKVAGILIENYIGDHQNQNYSIIGIGINVNSEPDKVSEISGIATSIFQETGNLTIRTALLRSFIGELENLYLAVLAGNTMTDEWKTYLDNIGDKITVKWDNNIYIGVAEDIDTNGNLILKLLDGSTKTLPAGEVTLNT
jgi:BirA family biotin operon repressor/biotin-[acetyl-CoA-carboxylase] ligase